MEPLVIRGGGGDFVPTVAQAQVSYAMNSVLVSTHIPLLCTTDGRPTARLNLMVCKQKVHSPRRGPVWVDPSAVQMRILSLLGFAGMLRTAPQRC